MTFTTRARALVALAATAGATLAVAGTADAASVRQASVYTLSNDAAGNAVVAFARAADGTLSPIGSYATGGLGTGSGLGSQGAIVLTGNARYLLAVNPGSDELSAFAVRRNGSLNLLETVSSGGDLPTSVTTDGNDVYALNAASGTIVGFTLVADGLEAKADSTRPLSSTAGAPAQIEYSPAGDQLVVTQRATNTIDVFRVRQNGTAGPAVANPSSGMTPFGFAFDHQGNLIVSNAAGGAPGASSATSYDLRRNGRIDAIDGPVGTTQSAACWVVVSKDGRWAYTTNTASNSISSYRIGADGSITLHEAVAGTTEGGPIDMSISRSGKFLYTTNASADSFSIFRVQADGSLAPVGTQSGLPATAVGMAAS